MELHSQIHSLRNGDRSIDGSFLESYDNLTSIGETLSERQMVMSVFLVLVLNGMIL